MTRTTGLTAAEVRAQLAFDVERLRTAACRLEGVDGELTGLRRRLEDRSTTLTREAMGETTRASDGTVQLRRAQAQATAEIARRAALGEVLRSSSRFSLIAAMAVSRWVTALRSLANERLKEAALRSHVEAGRLAHRILSVMRPHDGLRSGVGQLVSAVVVAELAGDENRGTVEEQIEEGLFRACSARGVRTEGAAIEAASRALRSAARLLEELAEEAEPAARALLLEADGVESRIATLLAEAAGSGREASG